MKIIIRILIMLSALFISWGVKAHQPDLSTTILVEQGKNKWVLQVRSALTAFEYEIEEHFGESSYTSPEEFNELVLSYVQENLSILFNKSDAAILQNGIVKLGHETSVTFEVKGTPENVHSIAVKNSSFGDIARNQSALILLKEGYSRDQFVLNNKNQHTVKLELNNSRFVLETARQGTMPYILMLFGGLSVIGLSFFFFFAYKNRRIFDNHSVLQNA